VSPAKASLYDSPEFSELVDLHCRARLLKEERFQLADKMRKDQLEEGSIDLDSLRNATSSRSRALADSIGNLIEKLSGDMRPHEKRVFNDSIKSRIDRMSCS